MKKRTGIIVISLVLVVAAVLATAGIIGVGKIGGTQGAGATSGGTTDAKPPEIPSVTDESYFNFTAKTTQNDKKETYTYYTVSAKNVENLPEILVIPSEYNGCEVRHIDNRGFAGAKIKKVYIPGSLNSTGMETFYGCTELEEVIISVESDASHLFIGDSTLEKCQKLEKVSFYNCNIMELRDCAFKDCTSLKEVNFFESNLYRIEKGAFENCASLRSLYIPKSVADVSIFAFKGCSELSFNVDAENENFYFTGKCLIKKKNKSPVWFKSFDDIPTDGSVTHIEDFSFLEDMGITEYVMPGFIESIGKGDISREMGGFINCPSLKSIVFSENLKEIPEKACYKLKNLKKVDLGSVVSIKPSAFDGCASLTEIVWSDKLEDLNSFNNLPLITEIVIPEGVKNVGSCFSNCENLSKVIIPDGVESIAGSFNLCPRLKSPVIPEGVKTINGSFSDCDYLTEITIPSTVDSLMLSFSRCKLLKKVELKNSGRIYGSFQECEQITEITVPDGVNVLEYSFWDCNNLRRVNLPSGITVTQSSFSNCPFLLDIYYAGTISEWKKINLGRLEGITIIHCKDGDVELGTK